MTSLLGCFAMRRLHGAAFKVGNAQTAQPATSSRLAHRTALLRGNQPRGSYVDLKRPALSDCRIFRAGRDRPFAPLGNAD